MLLLVGELAEIVVLGLAVWRLSALLVLERGPLDVFLRFRQSTDSLRGLLDCLWCTSVWVAGAITLLTGSTIIDWLAMSAVAIIVDSHVDMVVLQND